jgi:LCP family protein required for cell wall assembly
MFRLPNVLSVALGLVVGFLLASYWESHLGAAAASAIAGLVTALSWLVWWRYASGARIAEEFAAPPLGIVPRWDGGPAPTISDPDSEVAEAYRGAVERLEATTSGQVILVMAAAPGQGSTTVAMNLAIAATQAGRRVILVDGDPSRRGLSRFGHTGATPGLIDVAAGRATLVEASRMWDLAPDLSLPFIPAGSTIGLTQSTLSSKAMAEAIDVLSEGSDLVMIDTPPVSWDGNVGPLAAHADGTILVVTERTAGSAVNAATGKLAEAGAPVTGFILNRAEETAAGLGWPWRRVAKRVTATFLVALLGFIGYNAFQIWDSWRSVSRDQLDVAGAAAVLPLPGASTTDEDIGDDIAHIVTAEPTRPEVFQSFLVVGSDAGGVRADVITLLLVPPDGDPAIVSIPRDLYLPNRCTQGYERINASLAPCGTINGPTMLALAVEDYTGVEVDHFALFDFDGFEKIIDAVGGVKICIDHQVRDSRSFLDLPAGCTNASGAQALSWVRSRRTEELVDGSWRRMEGVNDLTRNQRQQDVILAMFSKMKAFGSISELTRTVRSLTDTFTLDDQLGLSDAISLAWSLRGIDPETVTRIEIPVRDFTTTQGARVLVPTTPFQELLAPVFPDLDFQAL